MRQSEAPWRCRRSPLLSAGDVIMAIELWRTGLYDTLDIARHLFVAEHAVSRALQAVRDLRYEQGGGSMQVNRLSWRDCPGVYPARLFRPLDESRLDQFRVHLEGEPVEAPKEAVPA